MRLEFSEFRDTVNVFDNNGNSIVFVVNSLYKSQQTASSGNVFGVLNKYIERELDARSQTEMFNLYAAAKNVLVNPTSLTATCAKLEKIIGQLTSFIDPEKFSYYIDVHGGIGTPANVKEDWAEIDESFTRNKTYLKSDYRDLVVLCIWVRPLMPIWGEFVGINKETVPEAQKEFKAYGLLGKSNIINLRAFARLQRYVTEVFNDNPNKDVAATTVGGIGQEDIPEWLCASLIVRRLGLLNLHAQSVDGPTNIISQVSTYVEQSIKNMGKRFPEKIHAKISTDNSVDPEKDPSYMELTRVKQSIPYGNLMATEVFLYGNLLVDSVVKNQDDDDAVSGRDQVSIMNAVKAIDPSVPEQLVWDVLKVTDGLENEEFTEHNFTLTTTILCLTDTISLALFDTLPKLAWTHAMIICQILLHHWEFHYLALSVTGININSNLINPLSDKLAKFTTEHLVQLDRIYPCKQVSKSKIAKNKSDNFAHTDIQHLGNLLLRYRKAVRTPSFLTSKDVAVDAYGHMTLPTSVSHMLVDLIVKLDNFKPYRG